MKHYTDPELSIELFGAADILTASDTPSQPSGDDENYSNETVQKLPSGIDDSETP